MISKVIAVKATENSEGDDQCCEADVAQHIR